MKLPKHSNLLYAIVIFLFLLPSYLFSQEPQWEIFFENMQGPIAVDPYNSDIIYIASRVSGESGFWKTTDSGNTWNKYTDGWGMGDPEFIYINPTNTNEVFVVGGPFVGVEKSTDAGETWIRADYGIPTDHHGFDIKQIAYDSTRMIYYLVDGGGGAYCDIYKSEDALQWEWIPRGSGCPTSIVIDESNSDIYVGTRNGNLWKSTNGGESWERRDTGIPDSTSIWHLGQAKGSQTLYAATSDGIYKTKNGGNSWFSVNDSLTSKLAFTAGLEVSKKDTTTIFAGAVISATYPEIPAGIYVSRNGGDTWQEFNTGLPDSAQNYYTLHIFLDNQTNTLFSSIEVPFDNYSVKNVYRFSDAVITGISEPLEVSSFTTNNNLNLQTSPNPFNSQTNLIYTVDYESRITLKIYDILGREVLTLFEKTVGPGKYSIPWQGINERGENMPSGIYFARMSSVSRKQETVKEAVTIKLLLIK